MMRYGIQADDVDLKPEDPQIMAPRAMVAADYQRCRELRVGIQVCRLLMERWLTLRAIGRELGLSSRSARRYVYALQAAGFTVECRRAPGGHLYRLDVRSWHGMVYLPKD